MFGGPVCTDWISYCPLDRVLTYKNLIYLLNLQFYWAVTQNLVKFSQNILRCLSCLVIVETNNDRLNRLLGMGL